MRLVPLLFYAAAAAAYAAHFAWRDARIGRFATAGFRKRDIFAEVPA